MIVFELCGYDLEEARQILKLSNKKMVRDLIKNYLDYPNLHKKDDDTLNQKLDKT